MLFFSYTKAEVLEGKVIKVLDGNTFELKTTHDEVYLIMLWGVDCPEPGQPFADEAKTLLNDLLLKKKVSVVVKGKDRKGVRLGEVNYKNEIINMSILESGLGWAEPVYSKGVYNNLEATIKAAKKGLWQDIDPTPPWIYRRQQSMKTAKSR